MAELDSQPKSVQSIYSWYSEGMLYVNRRYQRKLVWTLVEKQKLVESILRKFPVPAILLAERDSGGYEVIDGLQRLHTLISFVENGFPTLDEKFFDVSYFPTAQSQLDDGKFEQNMTGEKLTAREISTYLDYSLAISVMRGATERDIDEVFSRINTYGHRLSDQERRQAGVQGAFPRLIRELACDLRGDASSDILGLDKMPAISVDLPMTKHGYEVVAEEIFWVNQGILRSTDLRDSMDEQCLADIAASVVSGQPVERSKDTLDAIYNEDSPEAVQVNDALETYGSDRLKSELKFCIDEILKVCNLPDPRKLRGILFKRASTNPFPSVFAVVLVALHEALVVGQKKISSYEGVRSALFGLSDRIDTSRRSTSSEERRKNVDTIKGLINQHLVDAEPRDYSTSNSSTDIDAVIRRSEIETPHYELKQGILELKDPRNIDKGIFEKLLKTICAIANNGPGRAGSIFVGVTDKSSAAARVKELDGVEARKVGKRLVVGVKREAVALGESVEDYFSRFKNKIRNSTLSQPLRDDVLAAMDYHDYYGLGVIILSVPAQKELAFYGEDVYYRSGDETVRAAGQKDALQISKRFS